MKTCEGCENLKTFNKSDVRFQCSKGKVKYVLPQSSFFEISTTPRPGWCELPDNESDLINLIFR